MQDNRNTRIFTGPELIREAEARIRPYVRTTPFEPSPQMETGEGSVWLKLENQQRGGSFKIRGALNRMLTMTEEERQRGVVVATAGNHGIGIALAAEQLGISTMVIVPSNVDKEKKRVLERLEVELIVIGDSVDECEVYAAEAATKQGRVYISPYNDPDVVAGQGTLALEIFREMPHVEIVILGVGGGGLVSGVAAGIKALNPQIKIIAVSPSNSPCMFDLLAGTPEEFLNISATISDATAGGVEQDSITIDLCRALVDQWILVDEDEIHAAMKLLFFEHRQVVEGAGALSVAAYLKERERFQDSHTALVCCGGNIDMVKFCEVVG